ncbi:MAG: BlaI/MecI/CopY family transcriptional regulator [Planctomycetota bacterium]
MGTPRKNSLGDLQLAIMRVLWERGEASAGQVHRSLLAERGLAPTTIATMLRRMEDRGIVTHRREGRQFVYRPRVGEEEVHRSMVAELIERLFAGDPKALVNHLLREGEIDLDELEALRSRIETRERGGRDD